VGGGGSAAKALSIIKLAMEKVKVRISSRVVLFMIPFIGTSDD
jgi:hypothetical protein